jgi:hypothetical protein
MDNTISFIQNGFHVTQINNTIQLIIEYTQPFVGTPIISLTRQSSAFGITINGTISNGIVSFTVLQNQLFNSIYYARIYDNNTGSTPIKRFGMIVGTLPTVYGRIYPSLTNTLISNLTNGTSYRVWIPLGSTVTNPFFTSFLASLNDNPISCDFSSNLEGATNVIKSIQNAFTYGSSYNGLFKLYINITTNDPVLIINLVANVSCFLRGTKICCIDSKGCDVYIPIEEIRSGDLVKTYKHQNVRVKYIVKTIMTSIDSDFRIKDRMYKLSKEKYPELFEDLYITGGHPILVEHLTDDQHSSTIHVWNDTLRVEDKYRLLTFLNENAEIIRDHNKLYEIYDIILESDDTYKNYGIYANGLLTESMEENHFLNFSNMEIYINKK